MRQIPILRSELLLNFEAMNKINPELLVNRDTPIYVKEGSKIVRYENNEPAILKGLVLERATTNFIITGISGSNSQDRTGTITSTTELAPDGSNTAARFACSTTNLSQGRYWASRVNSVGKKYCFSAYLKPFGNVRYVSMAFDSSYYSTDYCNFDLQTGESRMFGSSSLKCFAEKLDNGWVRITGEFINRVAVPTGGGHTSIEVGNSITGPRRPAMASSASNGYLIWMPQVELGDTPTSPIVATSGSIVSRPAQTIATTLPRPIDSGNFTVFGRVVCNESGLNLSSYQDVFDFSDGIATSTSEGSRCSYVVLSDGRHSLVGNGAANTFAHTTANVGETVSFIYSAKDGIARATFDGVNIFTSPNISVGEFRKLNLGTNRNGGGNANGLIKKLLVYSGGITQQEMIRIWPFIG